MLASKKNLNGTDGAELRKDPTLCWYVVYTKPRSEKKVHERFLEANFETYCPIQKTKKNWTDRKKWVEEPVFKSYCFVRAFNNKLQDVRDINGVVNFVYWLRKPAILRDEDLETIKYLFSKHTIKEINSLKLKDGDTVKVRVAPFANQKAIIKKVYKKTITVELVALKLKISLLRSDVEI